MFEKVAVFVSLVIFSKLVYSQDIYFPNDEDTSSFAKHSNSYQQYAREYSQDNLAFTLTISRILREFHPYENGIVVFSPLSVSMVLAVIALGTKGPTRHKVLELLSHESELSFSSNIKGLLQDPSMKLANAIFKTKTFPLSAEFVTNVQSLYGSEVVTVNFASASGEAKSLINSWVANKTQGYIKDILAVPPAQDTELIVANSLYFAAEWETKFITGATEKKSFYPNGQNSPPVMVNTMATGGVFPYFEDPILGCEIVGLPYEGNATIMYVILPSKDSSLSELESKLSRSHLRRLISNSKYRSVIVSMPKMNLDQSVDLKSVLKRLDLDSVFTDDSKNSYPASSEGLWISDALHKSSIKVTETGTVAAASTLVTLTRDGSRIGFRVDRPFLFVIYHKQTQLVLFWASITQPDT